VLDLLPHVPGCSGTSVEFEGKNFLNQIFYFIGSRVETRRFQAMGQLNSTACTAPPALAVTVAFAVRDVADARQRHRLRELRRDVAVTSLTI
jgi:hypothetical protein